MYFLFIPCNIECKLVTVFLRLDIFLCGDTSSSEFCLISCLRMKEFKIMIRKNGINENILEAFMKRNIYSFNK